MSKMGKVKGASGEREALKWFMVRFPELGDLTRNLEQTRNGGADCLTIDGIALEVKRQEALAIESWWKQTTRQAVVSKRLPVLMYRQNRRQWFFCIPASLLITGSWGYLTLTSAEFTNWFKQWLGEGNEHNA